MCTVALKYCKSQHVEESKCNHLLQVEQAAFFDPSLAPLRDQVGPTIVGQLIYISDIYLLMINTEIQIWMTKII